MHVMFRIYFSFFGKQISWKNGPLRSITHIISLISAPKRRNRWKKSNILATVRQSKHFYFHLWDKCVYIYFSRPFFFISGWFEMKGNIIFSWKHFAVYHNPNVWANHLSYRSIYRHVDEFSNKIFTDGCKNTEHF